MRKNSIKNTRINEEVLRSLSEIIHSEIKDPRIHPMLTSVVSVEVAPDLKTCRAYISVLGDEQLQKETLAGLQSAEGYIRRSLARTVNLRNTPQITFIMDQSIAYGVNMSQLIDEVTKNSAGAAAKDGAEQADVQEDNAEQADAQEDNTDQADVQENNAEQADVQKDSAADKEEDDA